MDTKIFVMTHKKIEELSDRTILPEIYIPMQVGRAGKEDLGYLGDDSGDNISDKNSSYCELTGMYWLWKNMDCDIIGICHYRRFFTRQERLLEQEYIEERIAKYPIIAPNSCVVKDEDVYDHYRKRHYTKDLDLCREVIAEKYPEYLQAFDYAMKGALISIANMWITKKDIYDRYCTWLFEILFEVEKRLDVSGYDAYQRRVMGFLSERLFRVWLFLQPEAVTEENVKLIEPQEFKNAQKKVELLCKCAKLKITPLLQLYQSGAMQGTLAPELRCRDDFEGKIPIWVCWWQGKEQMPELVQCCLNSLERNIPKETTVIRIITMENYREYVTLTDTVIRKFNEGKISYTHLADILRAELLYRYGGMWIDATYYVTASIPKELFMGDGIYTLKFRKPIWDADITRGRWSVNLWCTPPGKKLFQFIMESFWYYFEMEDELLDYFFMDDVIAIAVDEFPDVKTELEQCPYCEQDVFWLQNCLNRKVTPDRIAMLKEGALFYKLNRRLACRTENMAGEQTVYGYLLSDTEG